MRKETEEDYGLDVIPFTKKGDLYTAIQEVKERNVGEMTQGARRGPRKGEGKRERGRTTVQYKGVG